MSLTPLTRYYVRIDATDTLTGASVSGSVLSFLTPAPPGRIDSTMLWSFTPFRTYETVQQLTVYQVPTDAVVEVICKGKGCPYAARARAGATKTGRCRSQQCKVSRRRRPSTSNLTVNLTPRFHGRHLAMGSHITVRVLKPNWVGKVFEFTMQRRVRPTVSCLAPDSPVPGLGC